MIHHWHVLALLITDKQLNRCNETKYCWCNQLIGVRVCRCVNRLWWLGRLRNQQGIIQHYFQRRHISTHSYYMQVSVCIRIRFLLIDFFNQSHTIAMTCASYGIVLARWRCLVSCEGNIGLVKSWLWQYVSKHQCVWQSPKNFFPLLEGRKLGWNSFARFSGIWGKQGEICFHNSLWCYWMWCYWRR